MSGGGQSSTNNSSIRQVLRNASKSNGVLVAGGTVAFLAGCTITYMSSQRYQRDVEETNLKLYGMNNNNSNNNNHVNNSNNTSIAGGGSPTAGNRCRQCVYSFVNDPNRSDTFQKVAKIYDEQIGRDELVMGINLLRRSLLYFHSKGNVLEVGAGTGRNIKYYPKNSTVNRVVLMDKSDLMLQEAKMKIRAITTKNQTSLSSLSWWLPSFLSNNSNNNKEDYNSNFNIQIDQEKQDDAKLISISTPTNTSKPQFACVVGDCENNSDSDGSSDSNCGTVTSQLSSSQARQDDKKPKTKQHLTSLQQFPSNSFDTIVDTFGLCSYNDPVVVLKELSRICKPNGKILLLEHGKSSQWEFITNYLDKHAERHAKNWGCVWNRDIHDIIQNQSSTFLQLDIYRTFHFGTTYYMVCSPIK